MEKVKVVKEALVEALNKRGLAMTDVSIETGHSKNYLSVTIQRDGAISKPLSIMLEQIYGITPDEYTRAELGTALNEEQTDIIKRLETNVAATVNGLRRLESCLDALNQTTRKIEQNMYAVIYTAMNDALNCKEGEENE